MSFDELKQIILALRNKGLGEKIEKLIDELVTLTMQAEEAICNVLGHESSLLPYTSAIYTFISRVAEKKGEIFAMTIAEAFCVTHELMKTPIGLMVAISNQKFWREFMEEEKEEEEQEDEQ